MFGLLPYALAAVLVAGVWLWDKATIASLRMQISNLQTEIDDPMTGWRRNLAVCIQNADMFSMQITIVNDKVDKLGEVTAAIQKDQKQLGINAQREGRALRDTVSSILTRPAEGATSCERALDILRAPLP